MYITQAALRKDLSLATLSAILRGGEYAAHQHIWKLFQTEADNQTRILFRRDDIGQWPRFLVVSSRPPEDTKNMWRIETKSYSPALKKGMRLAFSLRANPVVTRHDENGKQKRDDVIMAHKKNLTAQNVPKREWPTSAELIQTIGVGWLARRAENYGFSIDQKQVIAEAYQHHSYYKRGAKNPIIFSALDFNGLLIVDEPTLFQKALYGGIGPAKGFGCGMLMVRRV
ncbi:MAG: type I-E CRISPR-associated protein Cas6/Cse3/CasE [Nitrospinota bacterium]|nr:type I-E CRISPR-associated protein Cas6/Cse3/CasE [Nitrospinota bacterium]